MEADLLSNLDTHSAVRLHDYHRHPTGIIRCNNSHIMSSIIQYNNSHSMSSIIQYNNSHSMSSIIQYNNSHSMSQVKMASLSTT